MIPRSRFGTPGRTAAVGLLLLSPLLAGCRADALGADATSPGAPGGPAVVTAFYPLQFVAERVGGHRANVENLTAPGAEPHDLELTVPQVVDVAGSDVILLESGFQPAVDEARDLAEEGSDGPRVVDATRVAGLVGDDPHFWLDPTRLARLAAPVAAALAHADPAHAAGYRERADRLVDALRNLDSDFRQGLSTCAQRDVVVSHDAFGYLARRYRLHVVSIAGISPDAEPSPSRLAELADQVRRTGVTTVFSERLTSAALADTLAQEVGVGTAVLDPLEGLTTGETTAGGTGTGRAGPADYLSVMRENLAALRQAGDCS